MRKHLSVFMLHCRSTVYKVLGVMAAMAAAEGALVFFALRRPAEFPSLESFISQSRIIWAFAAAFLAVTALFCASGCEFGSRTGYTLCRLRISEKTVFLWQFLYDLMGYFILWAVQTGLALAFCRAYAAANPELCNNQTVFLAFYRSELLHSLLPLENWARWLRNFAFLTGTAAAAARYPMLRRRGKKGIWIILLAVLVLFNFAGEIELTKDLNLTGIFAFAAFFVFFGVYQTKPFPEEVEELETT